MTKRENNVSVYSDHALNPTHGPPRHRRLHPRQPARAAGSRHRRNPPAQGGPSSRVGRLAADGDAPPPYWAHQWAGGLALARHVLDHPESVAGRRVLDLGAGSGLVAIAAAKAGAAQVIAVEPDRHALAALALNAALNDVRIDVRAADVAAIDVPDVDMVLVGDLFYSDTLAGVVTAFLDRCLDRGIDALVGDPWRRPLPLARLDEIARYEVAETGTATRPGGVFRFHREEKAAAPRSL